jgi:ribosome biogenesis GTPase / thiamine phosphate phosphatase
LPGRVVSEHRTHHRVFTDAAEVTAVVTSRVRNTAAQRSELPGVGDFVAIRLAIDDGPATIEVVLPRVSALVRKASGERRPQLLAAIIDVALIVTAMDGDFNLLRLKRYLALVNEGGAVPVIVLNKADLATDVIGAIDQLLTNAPGIAVHAISARDGDGIFALEQYFESNLNGRFNRLVRRGQIDPDKPATGARSTAHAVRSNSRQSGSAHNYSSATL